MISASSESQAAQVTVLGPEETQDSQALYEAYKIELGVGTFSDSSFPERQTRPVAASSNRSLSHDSVLKRDQWTPGVVPGSAGVEQSVTRSRSLQTCTAAPNPDNKQQDVPKSPSPGRSTSSEPRPDEPNRDPPVDNREESALRDNQPLQAEIQHDVAALLDGRKHEQPAGPPTQTRKMDVSQQTPTQVNEDRDYDDDDAATGSWSPEQDNNSLLPDNEDRSLQAGDTGAVNFGDMSQFGRPSSQVSEDGGITTTRGDWRVPDQTSQLRSSTLFTPFKAPQDPAFETPIVPKNPFGQRAAAPVPFAGSQLFGQTQLLSSAIKKASPTSSRPSPHVLPNSFSPNLPETSPLKDRTNVSSPTDIRTSSPQRLNDIPETEPRRNNLERIEEETPSHSRSTEDEIIPESPTHKASRLSGVYKPREHYENMKASQQRKSSDGEVWRFVGSDSDSDDDAMRRMERRKKAERKRAQAAQEMEKVTFIPLPRNTSKERHGNKRRRVSPEVQVQTPRFQPSEETIIAQSDNVEPSQQKPASQSEVPHDGTTQGTEESDGEQEKEDEADLEPEELKATDPAADEFVPATSPTRPVITQSGSSLPKLNTDSGVSRSVSQIGPSSFSPKPARVQKSYGTRARQGRRATIISSSVSEAVSKELETAIKPGSPPTSSAPSTAVPGDKEENTNFLPDTSPPDEETEETEHPVSSTENAKRDSIEVRPRKCETPKAKVPVTVEAQSSSSSSLSSLSSEPPSSLITTPLIHALREKDGTISEDTAHAPSGRNLRARALRSVASSTSPQAVRNLRNVKRPRYGSESTDELIRSPSESVLEKSVTYPKLIRSFRHGVAAVAQTEGLFGGMIFALSFSQSKSQERTKLEARIAQAGGTIVNDGFEPLFEQSAILSTPTPIYDEDAPLRLVESFSEGGFTAVIADGHSRKPKYMQALALGLPCLAHQWITACLNRGEIVSWEDYLLCSGSSAVLDNAIRSRKLDTYPAAEAQLANVVECRSKLLEGQKVLVVMDSKKSRAEAKQPYIFLAQALGPRISRVFTAQQAQQAIKKHAKDGRPYQWIYVDKSAGTAESVMSSLGNGGGRKRKRSHSASYLSAEECPRVLNDELVIQSLILGRIIQEDEMEF
ncbi:unnamed protein product [Clonostachys rhizophaga]|uniref:BRCT domain-containing protein n=1 Tax=Clonostachys rhizophaga TaxID=160324 RepID=A0A9N9V823_9HYPO|nr:unnamed protein product [Clonostachys rhizophaga]